VIAEVEKERPNRIQADVDLEGASLSIQTKKKGWTITAYGQRMWNGAKRAGIRASRPLGLFKDYS
jgi:hypothetical protein